MKTLIQKPAYSLKDLRLLPGYTHEECNFKDISLKSPLCRNGNNFITLDLPFISAAMQSVTSVQLATALAELGGVGVIPLGDSIEEQCLKVKSVKQYKTGFRNSDKHIKFPCATEDTKKRLSVGAAVSTHPEDRERISELIETDVDFILIDASDGYTIYQKETIEWIKMNHDVPVVGGNIVTGEAFKMLVQAGADAVKIGMGTGSGCTTQEEKATGRGLATAIIEIVTARDAYAENNTYIPIIADGGINTPSDMAIALALGADSVMMGNFFARMDESPGKEFTIKGEKVKEYWMEGSTKAHNSRRYQNNSFTFFEEGVQGFVPSAGSIYDILPISRNKLIAAFRTAGAVNMKDFHRSAVLELQSPKSINDGKVNNMIQMEVSL
jgi:IMP dehydrogenase